ncbi:hypothetical protein L1887_05477 [Cichorium endivia]|nr:hypothetical protein L1887_05477 [Cichorium endivia]
MERPKDPPSARQNAKETRNQNYNNMSTKDKKDIVLSTNCNDNTVDKRALLEENPKESSFNSSQPLMPVDHSRFDEEYRKSSFDNDKDKIQERLEVHKDKEQQDDNRTKTVRWLDEAEKNLMDLGVSEDERTKRLESLMERRRSRKLSSFQVRRSGTGIGIGNSSCTQISSLNIPKYNPFLADSSSDPNTPVSAPSYMAKSNPFDLPYDPHEEKPILTGDTSEDESNASNQKEPRFNRHGPTKSGHFAPPEFTSYKHKTGFEGDFSIKQLASGRLVTETVENKQDDKKQLQQDGLNPNHKEENKEDDKKQPQQDSSKPSENVAEKVVDIPDEKSAIKESKKEKEIDHEISINESSSSSSCSEDEPIMKPNKEAILHCLSMSRMRLVSQGKSFHRHAETFDCGPSSLFDKSKTDSFYFGGNKKFNYGSTNSIASDMQVEVSEIGSPSSTSLDLQLKSCLGDSTYSFDTDFNENEVRLSDTDDFSDQDSESGFSRTDHDSQERSTFEKL